MEEMVEDVAVEQKDDAAAAAAGGGAGVIGNDHQQLDQQEQEQQQHDNADDDGDADDVRAFYMSKPISDEELDAIEPRVVDALRGVLKKWNREGGKALLEEIRRQEQAARDRKARKSKEVLGHFAGLSGDGGGNGGISGDARNYQTALLRIAKRENVIVHLGTGTGKTLIAILLIKHYRESEAARRDTSSSSSSSNNDDDDEEGGEAVGRNGSSSSKRRRRRRRQTVFLVPSVTLAIQQTAVLRDNLDATVGTASSRTVSGGDNSRTQLADVDVLVATHGAYFDLLSYHGRLFDMDDVNLLVVDECHHCTGNSAYAQIMKHFYHKARVRPHVLGLTASPLINVRGNNATDAALRTQLHELESLMDARVVSPGEFGVTDENSLVLQKEAVEVTVRYRKETGNFPRILPCPCPGDGMLLRSRRKELRQLESVYEDLGPYIVAAYARSLRGDLKLNAFEHESQVQFENAVRHLDRVVAVCDGLCRGDPATLGRTDKLLALEELIEGQIEERPDAVGLVFVQRRVTAMALNEYFSRRLAAQRSDKPWPDARRIRGTGREPIRAAFVAEEANAQPARLIPEHVNVSADPSTITGPSVATALDEEDQFADADSEMDFSEAINSGDLPAAMGDVEPDQFASSAPDFDDDDPMEVDQFADADSVDDPTRVAWQTDERNAETSGADPRQVSFSGAVTQQVTNVGAPSPPPSSKKHTIRCCALVRKASNIFKLKNRHRASANDDEELHRELEVELQQESKIREVLSSLRRGECNVLVATSVVEEGVDVTACSFVAAFDSISTTKSYVQMKGRARQEDAKFFSFDAADSAAPFAVTPSSSLADHQLREKAIRDFLSSRDPPWRTPTVAMSRMLVDDILCENASLTMSTEMEALCQGYYSAPSGKVILDAAKSLLNRFIMSQPLDDAVRKSKAALQAHLPSYDKDNNVLFLPSHIADPSLRVIELPVQYHGKKWKERQNIMSLIACIRLHQCGLLTESLLPLTKEIIESKLVGLATAETRDGSMDDDSMSSYTTLATESSDGKMTVYVHRIIQESDVLTHYRECLRGSHLHLAVVATRPFGDVPTFKQHYPQFGDVTFSLAGAVKSECTTEELDLLSDFFTLTFNARWKPKAEEAEFKFRSSDDKSGASSVPVYRVGCVDEFGDFLWDHMSKVVRNSARGMKERAEAVRGLSDVDRFPSPRLWSPEWDCQNMYIVYGPSGERADTLFPHASKAGDTGTYADYFKLRWNFEVRPDSMLFDAQRLWYRPHRYGSQGSKTVLSKVDRGGGFDGCCRGLVCVKLPKDACFEPPMADPTVYLLSTFLPMILYHMERSLCAHGFIEHCSRRLPHLGRLLKRLPLAEVVSVLSAKSCEEVDSYERLEWLGDAVLKLVQTEVILKSTDLREWIRNMHEGYLSAIRSVMGSNKRLISTCKRLGVDRFILTLPLNNRQWTPSPLELFFPPSVNKSPSLDGKICADFLEALLGLAYKNGNYSFAMQVAEELQVTLPAEASYAETGETGPEVKPLPKALKLVEDLTNYCFRDNQALVLESLTHPTALNPKTPSYQRLEWVGDAVLCLSARCWIFRKFPDADVKTMVLMETVLVCNETLAFLCLKSGLHRHILHYDPTLPKRIHEYARAVEERGRGLWGTNPPKPLADVIEASLGAIHIHGGFAEGQQATEKVLEPVLDLLEKTGGNYEQILQHPLRKLYEIGGKLLSLTAAEESECARQNQDGTQQMVWVGRGWGYISSGGCRSVATIKCLGMTLMSLVDDSPSSASNRACACILSVLDRNPELTKSFVAMRKEASQSETSNDNDDTSMDDDADGNSSI